MPWFRLDDSFHSHPKVIAAGNEAIGLFIRCGTYAAQNLTDGAVPRDIAVLYGAETHPWGADGSRGTETLGDILVRVGLWHRTRAGWRIHDYLDYNFSRDQVLKDRKAAAERQRKWKQARQGHKDNGVTGPRSQTGKHRRVINAQPDANTPVDNPSDTQNRSSQAHGNAVSNGVSNTTPPRPAPKGSGAGGPAPGAAANGRASPSGSPARGASTTPQPPPVADVLARLRQLDSNP